MDRSTREEGGTTARALSMLQGRSVGTLRVVLSALPKRGDSNTAASSFGAPHEHATRVARSAQASSSSRSDHTGTSAAVPPPRSKSSNDATAGSRKSMFTSVVYPDFEPGCCDYSHRERLANLVTSVPFFFAGAHILRNSQDKRTTAWGAGVIASGIASTFFHSFINHEQPFLKSIARKLDYSTVSVATALAVKAMQVPTPPGYFALTAGAMPLNPLAVATMNIALLERTYIQRARANPKLRNDHRAHYLSGAIAMSAFAVEDIKTDIPFSHATWHTMAALATATMLPMVPMPQLETTTRLRRGGIDRSELWDI